MQEIKVKTEEDETKTILADIALTLDKNKDVNNQSSNKNSKRNLGKTKGFYFKDNEPQIIIGPHCNSLFFYETRAIFYLLKFNYNYSAFYIFYVFMDKNTFLAINYWINY